MDLCQLAQYTDYEHAGQSLKRGEIFVSVRTLAERWGWSKSRTSRFIIGLTGGTLIELVSGTREGSVYRIVDYELMAGVQTTEWDTNPTSDRAAGGTRAGHERDKKNKEEGKRELFLGEEIGEKPNGKPKAKPKKKATSLPPEWEPNDNHRARAAELGVNLEREVEKFKLHAEANGRTQKNWNASFTAWIISDFCPKTQVTESDRLDRTQIW